MVTPAIDAETCTRCGTCVAECPVSALTLVGTSGDGPPPPVVAEDLCFDCGHCGAICPTGAVRSAEGEFVAWHAPEIEPGDVKAFLTGRRSVRRYRADPVGRDVIEELLSVAPFAPTASNAQDVGATIVTGDRVFELATQVNAYYLSFETLLRRWYLWPLLWFTAARPYLKSPRKIAAIRTRAQRFDREHDWLFFRAPAVVVLSAPRKNRAFGRTNSVIAAERMMQYAFALGLGSCWIGYAEVALQRRSAIAEWIGIGPDRCPQAVFTLGRPAVEYHRLPVRRPLSVRWV